jgi:hypothetical protein
LEEFLRQNYSLLTRLIVISTAFIGVLNYRKFKTTPVSKFIVFLVFVSFIEIIANYPSYLISLNKYYLLDGTLIKQNYWWYTIAWTMGSALFFSYYLNKVVETKFIKNILQSLFWIMVMTVFIVLIFDYKQVFNSFPVIIEIVSFLVVVFSVIFYFIEVLLSDKILNFYKSIHFYICTAILFWWLVTTPLVFYEVYHSTSDWDYIILKWQIRLFANVVMYLTFSMALIWCKPQNN